MTYDTQVDDKTTFEIPHRLKEVGGIAGIYCEDSGMIAALQTKAKTAGRMGVENRPATRPAATEAEATDRLLRLAEVTDIPAIVVHLTCREGCDAIIKARRRGQKVYAETCPQYLLMDNSLYGLTGMKGAKYVCAPPLGRPEDPQCLWRALTDGTTRTVSTDHRSFTTAQRVLGKDNSTKVPGGMPEVETRGALLCTYDVDAGRVTRERMRQLLSENPVKLYGVYPRKEVIAPGSDADIVVIRTGVENTVTAAGQMQNVDYAPFEGRKLTARIEGMFLRSTQVVKDHQAVVEEAGRFVERGKYAPQAA